MKENSPLINSGKIFTDRVQGGVASFLAKNPEIEEYLLNKKQQYSASALSKRLINTVGSTSPLLSSLSDLAVRVIERKEDEKRRLDTVVKKNSSFITNNFAPSEKDPKFLLSKFREIDSNKRTAERKGQLKEFMETPEYKKFQKLYEQYNGESSSQGTTGTEEKKETPSDNEILKKIEVNTELSAKLLKELKEKSDKQQSTSGDKESSMVKPRARTVPLSTTRKNVTPFEQHQKTVPSTSNKVTPTTLSERFSNPRGMIGKIASPLLNKMMVRAGIPTKPSQVGQRISAKLSSSNSKVRRVLGAAIGVGSNVLRNREDAKESQLASDKESNQTQSILSSIEKNTAELLKNDKEKNKGFFSKLGDLLSGLVGSLGSLLSGLFSAILLKKGIGGLLSGAGKAVKSAGGGIAAATKSVAGGVASTIQGAAKAVTPGIGTALKSLGSSALEKGSEVIQKVSPALKTAGSGILDGLKSLGSSALEKSKTLVTAVTPSVTKAGSGILDGLKSLGSSALEKGSSGVKGLGSLLPKGLGVLSAGTAVYDGYTGYESAEAKRASGEITDAESKIEKGKAIGGAAGGLLGGLKGAALGAAAGTVAIPIPILGSIIGAIGGGVAGYAGGSFLGGAAGGAVGASLPSSDPTMPGEADSGQEGSMITAAASDNVRKLSEITGKKEESSKEIDRFLKMNEDTKKREKMRMIEESNASKAINSIGVDSKVSMAGPVTSQSVKPHLRNEENSYDRVQMNDYWGRVI